MDHLCLQMSEPLYVLGPGGRFSFDSLLLGNLIKSITGITFCIKLASLFQFSDQIPLMIYMVSINVQKIF